MLAGGPAELERLRLQARVWEKETGIWLDEVEVQPGWTCLDLGCGAMGILGLLSKRVGPEGKVIGVDLDQKQLAAAQDHIHQEGFHNVIVLEQDACHTELPRETSDFTHVRFVFAPVGRDHELLQEMLSLTRPGGIIAIQEPDATSWQCYPREAAWDRLKAAILEAFQRGGGDFNAGQRTFAMLQAAGLEEVRMRAAVVGLHGTHPYRRLPVQFATSLRKRILDENILTETELDGLIQRCEEIAADPRYVVISFVVTQVWGRKPL